MSWQLIGIVITLFITWNAFLVGIIRYLIVRSLGKIDEKFTALEKDIEKESCRRRELETQLHTLETNLPNKFVQREDWIRFSTTIDHKMDKFYDKLVEIAK